MSETVTATKRAYTRTLKTYVVSQEDGGERLIRAYTPGEALKHCMPELKVHLASHDDIIELMAGGCPVETVGLPEAVPADEPAGLTD
jgi:hypothetical protein